MKKAIGQKCKLRLPASPAIPKPSCGRPLIVERPAGVEVIQVGDHPAEVVGHTGKVGVSGPGPTPEQKLATKDETDDKASWMAASRALDSQNARGTRRRGRGGGIRGPNHCHFFLFLSGIHIHV